MKAARTRVCRRCGKAKPLSEFRLGGFGRMRTCKGCQSTSGFGGKCVEPKRREGR